MPKDKRPYLAINVPKDLEDYFNELLEKPEYQVRLKDAGLQQTSSSLGRWIIEQFLIENTSYRFIHLNTYEDHVIIQDKKMSRIFAVFFKNEGLLCELCEASDCEHIQFAVSLPEVERALATRGQQYKRE